VIAGNPGELADVARYARRWQRLGERLHPHEHPGCPHAQQVFAVARGERTVRSLAGRVELALRAGDTGRAQRVERDSPRTVVGHRVGQQQHLPLCRGEGALAPGNGRRPRGTSSSTAPVRRPVAGVTEISCGEGKIIYCHGVLTSWQRRTLLAPLGEISYESVTTAPEISVFGVTQGIGAVYGGLAKLIINGLLDLVTGFAHHDESIELSRPHSENAP
jgi:hypothetical protein